MNVRQRFAPIAAKDVHQCGCGVTALEQETEGATLANVTSRFLASAVFFVALALNPGYFGCGTSDNAPNFGETEMLQSLDAANEIGTWTMHVDGVDYEVTLSLIQTAGEDSYASRPTRALFGNVAHACGSRTFMQSASACVTRTELIVDGELTLRRVDADGPFDLVSATPVHGSLTSYTTTLGWVALELAFGDANRIALHANDARDYTLASFDADGIGIDAISIHYQAPQ